MAGKQKKQEQLLSTREVAERLSCSVRTVWRLRDNGTLPDSVRVGGLVRWRESDLDQYLRKLS